LLQFANGLLQVNMQVVFAHTAVALGGAAQHTPLQSTPLLGQTQLPPTQLCPAPQRVVVAYAGPPQSVPPLPLRPQGETLSPVSRAASLVHVPRSGPGGKCRLHQWAKALLSARILPGPSRMTSPPPRVVATSTFSTCRRGTRLRSCPLDRAGDERVASVSARRQPE
jgi:hypothetical protein